MTTRIDHLFEDPPISGQAYCLVSFISPEQLKNCSTRGIKVRGNFATRAEAEVAAERLRAIDKYFDIFVGDVGKWLPWDPDPLSVKEAKYANNEQNEIMKPLHERAHEQQIEDLNDMVAAKKEQLANDGKEHGRRVDEALKANKAGQETNAAKLSEDVPSASPVSSDSPDELTVLPQLEPIPDSDIKQVKQKLDRKFQQEAGAANSTDARQSKTVARLQKKLAARQQPVPEPARPQIEEVSAPTSQRELPHSVRRQGSLRHPPHHTTGG
jgi:hypothetical protein